MNNCFGISNEPMFQSLMAQILTYSDFIRIVSDCFPPFTLHIGKVKYINYAKESCDERLCFFTPFLYKMKSFEHENEVRAIVLKYPEEMKDHIEMIRGAQPVFNVGTYVDVNLELLIENVYIAPTAQLWFRELVESTMKKYSLNLTPKWTDMHNEPLY